MLVGLVLKKAGAAEDREEDDLGPSGRASQRRWSWSWENAQDLQEGGLQQGEEDEQDHRGRKAWVVPEAGRGPAPSSLDLPAAGGLLAASPDAKRGPQALRSSEKPGKGRWLEQEAQLCPESRGVRPTITRNWTRWKRGPRGAGLRGGLREPEAPSCPLPWGL